MTQNNLMTGAVAIALVLVSCGPVLGALTPVSLGGEASHQAIFEGALGLGDGALSGFNANAAGTQAFTVGADEWTFTRVDDSPSAGPLEICLPELNGRTDQMWRDGLANFGARARYAGYGQSLGYDAGAGYQNLLTVTGSGVNPSFNGGGLVDLSGLVWTFERSDQPDGTGNVRSSLEAKNGGLDHMVTYLVTGPDVGASGWSWWLFWEDLDGLGDADYNDLAVELYCDFQVVPAPAAAVLGVIGLGCIGWLKRKKN